MNKIIKFSKSYNSIFKIKKDFYTNNQLNLKKAINVNNYYIKQPLRTKCKNCNKSKLNYIFKSFKVNYFICKICSHLNGAHEDTKQFNNYLYKENSGKSYARNYLSDYNSRVKNIYIPKIKFLKKVIGNKFNLIDIGSGVGHFLKACEINGIKASGYEPNLTMINLAKKKLSKNSIFQVNLENVYEKILHTNAKCISMIGVIEHLNNPRKVFYNFKKSKATFLFFSVPLFSLSTLLENIFQDVFPRQLSGGHTHLYTNKSISYLINEFNLKIKGEWWFGTDFSDLFRSLITKSKFEDRKIKKYIYENFLFNHIDNLQNILDKSKVCSEVHMILTKKYN